MICLTGDVHQPLGSLDQQAATLDEVACALRYAEIAAAHGLKVTFFVTARAVTTHPAAMQALAQMDNVSLGGHTVSAFQPRWMYRALRVLGGGTWPGWYQRWDARHTRKVVERASGAPCVTWRTHAFRADHRTPAALAAAGIGVVSDEATGPSVLRPRQRGPLVSLPLNTHEDHTHLYHGLRTPERVQHERAQGKGLGVGVGPDPESYTPAAWLDIVTTQVQQISAAGGLATLLVHPLCMHVVDDFATFADLCLRLASYPSIWAQEATAFVNDDRAT